MPTPPPIKGSATIKGPVPQLRDPLTIKGPPPIKGPLPQLRIPPPPQLSDHLTIKGPPPNPKPPPQMKPPPPLQVQDGLFVKLTRDPRETAAYLGLLGGRLRSIYGVGYGVWGGCGAGGALWGVGGGVVGDGVIGDGGGMGWGWGQYGVSMG